LMRYVYIDGERRLEPSTSVSTNDLGEFRAFGLEPKKYYLSAKPRSGGGGFGIGDGVMLGAGADTPDEGYATVYYPGTTDITNATAIDVRAGEETRADLTLIPTRTYRVRGRLIGPDGEPARDSGVMLMPRNGVGGFMSGNMTNTAKDGGFEVRGVSAGAYTLTAMTQQEDTPMSARLDLDVGESNVENVNLVLSPGREVSGVVRLEGDGSTKLSDLSVVFMPARAGRMFFGPGGFAQVKADGSFTAKSLGPEDYIVSVNEKSDDSYLKSVRSGGEELLYTGVNVAKVKAPIEIVISSRGARLEGAVAGEDGKAVQGAMVIAVPEKPVRARRGSAGTTSTDQNGRFLLRGLRPGNYQLYAFDDVDEDQFRDPEFLAKFADKAVTIRLDEGGRFQADLRVVPLDSGGTGSGN
jgi:hypothetical protein